MSQKKALVAALITGAGILGVSTLAFAEVPGFYAGAQIGYGMQDLNNPNLQPLLESNLTAVSSTNASNTKSGAAGGIYGGFQFNDYFAAELGYIHFPNASFNNSVTGFNTLGMSTVNSSTLTSTENAIDIMLKGMIPFGGGFGGYAKIGGAYVFNKFTISLNGVSSNPTATNFQNISGNGTNDQFKPIGAVGLTYDFNDNVVMDLSYTYLFGSSGNSTSSSNLVNNLNNLSNVNIGVPKAGMVALGITYYFTGGGTDDP